MLVDQDGKEFNPPSQQVNFLLMRKLLETATKRLPFAPSPEAKVRQVARECTKWPQEEPEQTLRFEVRYG